jgi:iron transport multicopper oxidase
VNSTLPTGPLAQGATFSFPVTWNLTQASINFAQNASFGKELPGVASTNLDIYTTNSVAKYSNILPVSLTGNTVSQTAFLTISPPEVDFGGVVVGSQAAVSGLSAAMIISNLGAENLTFLLGLAVSILLRALSYGLISRPMAFLEADSALLVCRRLATCWPLEHRLAFH